MSPQFHLLSLLSLQHQDSVLRSSLLSVALAQRQQCSAPLDLNVCLIFPYNLSVSDYPLDRIKIMEGVTELSPLHNMGMVSTRIRSPTFRLLPQCYSPSQALWTLLVK
jgi:hypothetical protein